MNKLLDHTELRDLGYKILARSEDGNFKVTSFTANYKGKRVYGTFDNKKQQYLITNTI